MSLAGSVLILGIPYFGKMLAGQLRERGWRAEYFPHPGRDARAWMRLTPRVLSADVLYLISSRIDRRSPQAQMMHVRRKPVIVHWVGLRTWTRCTATSPSTCASHDGMSFMALEALSRGRYVIWTYPLEGAIQGSGLSDVVAALGQLKECHESGLLALNEAGRAATLERFDQERVLGGLDAALRGVLGA